MSSRKPRQIKSDFALLDVKRGQFALFKALGYSGHRNGYREGSPLPVVITGEIVGAWGDGDGISQEFEVRVFEVKVTP